MIINANTKVSEVLKANKNSIDALASLAKPLAKLRNPVLRKVMASRVTLSEAAKMGGCTLEDIINALKPLGFTFEAEKESAAGNVEKEPDWLKKLSEERIQYFDVRALLAGGTDPLKEIMAQFKKVPEGEALCIIVNFEPVPLINLLGKGNVKCFTRQLSPVEFHSYFYKAAKSSAPSKGKAGGIFKDTEPEFKTVLERYDEQHLVTIDVRALEMPGPMQAILGELEKLPGDSALYVYHKRIPVYLLEDLSGKAFEVHIHVREETDVRMLLFKTA